MAVVRVKRKDELVSRARDSSGGLGIESSTRQQTVDDTDSLWTLTSPPEPETNTSFTVPVYSGFYVQGLGANKPSPKLPFPSVDVSEAQVIPICTSHDSVNLGKRGVELLQEGGVQSTSVSAEIQLNSLQAGSSKDAVPKMNALLPDKSTSTTEITGESRKSTRELEEDKSVPQISLEEPQVKRKRKNLCTHYSYDYSKDMYHAFLRSRQCSQLKETATVPLTRAWRSQSTHDDITYTNNEALSTLTPLGYGRPYIPTHSTGMPRDTTVPLLSIETHKQQRHHLMEAEAVDS